MRPKQKKHFVVDSGHIIFFHHHSRSLHVSFDGCMLYLKPFLLYACLAQFQLKCLLGVSGPSRIVIMAHVQPKRGLFDSESEQDPVVRNLSGVYECSSFYHGSHGGST